MKGCEGKGKKRGKKRWDGKERGRRREVRKKGL